MDCDEFPCNAEWKNVAHPVDRMVNWCIGGWYFTMVQVEDITTKSVLVYQVISLDFEWIH
jgi:hypothetical protein